MASACVCVCAYSNSGITIYMQMIVMKWKWLALFSYIYKIFNGSFAGLSEINRYYAGNGGSDGVQLIIWQSHEKTVQKKISNARRNRQFSNETIPKWLFFQLRNAALIIRR